MMRMCARLGVYNQTICGIKIVASLLYVLHGECPLTHTLTRVLRTRTKKNHLKRNESEGEGV